MKNRYYVASIGLLLTFPLQLLSVARRPGRPVESPNPSQNLPNKEPKQDPDTAQNNDDYKNAFDLVKDFFDLEVKEDKGMNYWARQIILLIKKKNKSQITKLLPFVKEFHQAHQTRNALGIGLAFKNHKNLFHEPKLTQYIENRIKREGLNSLLIILKHRINKREDTVKKEQQEKQTEA